MLAGNRRVRRPPFPPAPRPFPAPCRNWVRSVRPRFRVISVLVGDGPQRVSQVARSLGRRPGLHPSVTSHEPYGPRPGEGPGALGRGSHGWGSPPPTHTAAPLLVRPAGQETFNRPRNHYSLTGRLSPHFHGNPRYLTNVRFSVVCKAEPDSLSENCWLGLPDR